MKLNQLIVDDLKTLHPREWKQFEKHLNQYKHSHPPGYPCDEEAALYFYSAGVREVSSLVADLGKLLADVGKPGL